MKKFNIAYNINGVEVQESLTDSLFTFMDGSIRVKLSPEMFRGALSCEYAQEFKISAYITGLDDLMVVSQIVDILKRNTRVTPTFTLQITSPAYARYDRVMLDEKNDGFGLLSFVKFIVATGVDAVELYDPHSDMFQRLLEAHDLKVGVVHQKVLFNSTTDGKHDYIRVYPDKGSLNKQFGSGYAPVVFHKHRNPETSRITAIECVEGRGILNSEQDAPFIIIDDICEGGGTFLGVAKEFWKLSHSANELELYITHGLMTKTSIPDLFNTGMFSKIYVCIMKESTYDAIPEVFKGRIVVKHLVEGM